MANKHTVDDSKYAGSSKTIEVLGNGNAYGWMGSIIGLIGGGAFAAVSTKESGKWTQKATDVLKNVGVDVNGKWAMIAGGAFLGSQILHFAGIAVGLRVGARKAGAGQEQFERLKSQCDGLKVELKNVQDACAEHTKAESVASPEPQKKYSDTMDTKTNFVDAITNEQASDSNLGR